MNDGARAMPERIAFVQRTVRRGTSPRDVRKLLRRCVCDYTFRPARSDAIPCRRLICYRGVGRGCGVGRGLGVTLGVVVGVGVTVGVDVGVGVTVGVGVAVGVGVGVGWAPGNA